MARLDRSETAAGLAQENRDRLKRFRIPLLILVVAGGTALGGYALHELSPEILQALHHVGTSSDGGSHGGKPPVDVLSPAPQAGSEYPVMLQPFEPKDFDSHLIAHFNGQELDTISYPVFRDQVNATWLTLHPHEKPLEDWQTQQLWDFDRQHGVANGWMAANFELFSRGGVNSVEAHNNVGDQTGTDWVDKTTGYGYRDFGPGWEGLKAGWESDAQIFERQALADGADKVGLVFPQTHGHPNGPDLAVDAEKIMLRNNITSLKKAGYTDDEIYTLQHAIPSAQGTTDSSAFVYFPIGEDTAN